MIQSVTYTGAGTLVSIVTRDGTVWLDDASLPPDTELRQALAGWIAAGGEIAPAPGADPVEAARAAKLAEIAAAAEALLSAGYPTGGLHIAVDDGARADLTAMAATALGAAGGALPWPAAYATGWIAIENVRIPLPTPADGLALAAGVGAWYAALVQHRRDLKDDALSAPDLAALATIEAGAGWPG